MFKHFLLPTDGSKLSEEAIRMGVQLAKTINAKVTGFYAIPEFHVFTFKTQMLEDTKSEFVGDSKAHAAQYLSVIETAAKAAGVTYEVVSSIHDDPYEAIIQIANERGCDLIVMASHGRKGVQAVLLGSETQKVLTHSHIPVLVCHPQ